MARRLKMDTKTEPDGLKEPVSEAIVSSDPYIDGDALSRRYKYLLSMDADDLKDEEVLERASLRRLAAVLDDEDLGIGVIQGLMALDEATERIEEEIEGEVDTYSWPGNHLDIESAVGERLDEMTYIQWDNEEFYVEE
jgi:hypothetical protein